METAIETRGLTCRFGRFAALDSVDLSVPAGSLYALLGPNGAGKTTLLKVLTGLLRPTGGRVRVLGLEPTRLKVGDRASIGYVAEGQRLPGWMTVEQLEAYTAPLYPRWDRDLAADLKRRFRLPAGRKLRRMSRGERMKAALLCALAPRPRLLVMDEPFTGMDALVKDDLVRGVLEMAGSEGWTVLICSQDIGELELLADRVGFLDHGRLIFSEPLDVMLGRFRRVELVLESGDRVDGAPPPNWLNVERSGDRVRFMIPDHESSSWREDVRRWYPGEVRSEVRTASLREIFVALARDRLGDPHREEVVA